MKPAFYVGNSTVRTTIVAPGDSPGRTWRFVAWSPDHPALMKALSLTTMDTFASPDALQALPWIS